MTDIHLAISTCPNDTYAFHGLINRQVDWQGLNFQIELLDISELNRRLFAGEFHIAKASFHAACLLADHTVVLPSGSALGFGVGPLLLAANEDSQPENLQQLTLCPGPHTTASLLFRMFYPETTTIQHVVFSEIMPALKSESADFGVCIHEGRFTFQHEGLFCVEDLGNRWENETASPLPLGGILGRNSLGIETLKTVQSVIRSSLEFANAYPEKTLPTMRKHAQEFQDDVLMKHVELYVNDWTLDLGSVGKKALTELSTRAAELQICTADQQLKVLDCNSTFR